MAEAVVTTIRILTGKAEEAEAEVVVVVVVAATTAEKRATMHVNAPQEVAVAAVVTIASAAAVARTVVVRSVVIARAEAVVRSVVVARAEAVAIGTPMATMYTRRIRRTPLTLGTCPTI